MKKGKTLLFISLVAILMGISACKSEYEKIRQSNDAELMLKKGLEYFDKKEYEKSQLLLEQAISHYRGKKEGEELFFKYAYTHYYLNQYILAAHYFKNFANTFINSPDREEAAFMSAYSNVKNSPNYRLDQEFTLQAIDELQQFINTYPKSDRVQECNDLIDQLRGKLEKKLLEEAKLYYNLREYQSADQSFNNLLKEYPDSKNAEEVRFLLVKSAYNLAKNSVYEKRAGRYNETIRRVDQFLKKYPSSKYIREVKEYNNLSKTAIKELKNE